jgi:hypothetical protein
VQVSRRERTARNLARNQILRNVLKRIEEDSYDEDNVIDDIIPGFFEPHERGSSVMRLIINLCNLAVLI